MITSRPAETNVAHTTHCFHGIPGGRIDPSGFRSQHALRETNATVVAVIGASLALTGQPVVAVETLT